MARVITKKSTVAGKVPLAADLEIGELAVNTADAKLYTKHNDGSVKQLGGDAASGYFRTEPVTATASGQTSFTVPGGYTPGAIFVSLNGASLPPADYTATNGTTIVLASGSGIVAGSVLLVHALSAFEVADALPLGGTAADSSKLGGSAAAEFYQRSNILGTVSQSGGVPTGAIIERGSNANGEYVSFADGTQICLLTVSVGDISNAAGAIYRSSAIIASYPAAFSVVPTCFVQDASSAYVWGAANGGGGSVTIALFYHTSLTNRTARVLCVGRWY